MIAPTARRSHFNYLSRLALLTLTLALIGCGGGGGGGDGDDDEDTLFSLLSTANLDGVVFGDNAQVQGRSDLQPAVGDAIFISAAAAGASQFQAYFSFDLSSLPAGATIKSAVLSLFNRAIQGDPQDMMVLVRVDHVNYGTVFPQVLNGGTGLDLNFATINDIGTTGRKNIDAMEQVQADLDASRTRSQFRLRGAVTSDFDSVSDVAFLTDAEDSQGSGELPMLIIEIE